MTDPAEAIRAKLDEVDAYTAGHHDLPYADEMRAAIVAVLDLHKPRLETFGYEPRTSQRLICSAETHVGGSMNDYTDYPCETVTMLASPFGVEVHGG